jgi:hypothetical protein
LCFAKLKGNHAFKKRGINFANLPTKFKNKINFTVVEYCREFKETVVPYGNSEDKKHYIRTGPAIQQKGFEMSYEKMIADVIEKLSEK